MRRWWVLALLAMVAAVLCVLQGHASRYALNPDGVAYLDMAANLTAGDWKHFLQGYWSPLYAIQLAILGTVSGAGAPDILPIVHMVDALLAVGVVLIIAETSWRLRNAAYGFAGIPLFLVASGRLPRVEAVTPDVLLAFLFALLVRELLLHGPRRTIRLGLLFGASYLVKTSSWPWLLAALAVSLAGARTRADRIAMGRIAAVALVVMLAWIVPLSVAYGKPTLGSTGRLNYQWYIANANTRLPDTHTGHHQRYIEVPFDSADATTAAVFDPAPWTYQPWGDPTAWDAGLIGGYTTDPKVSTAARIWNELAPMIRIWTLGVTLAVLLPLLLVGYRRGRARRLWREDRTPYLLMALGLLGIGQFLAVHSEPRLIAPFVMLAGLGAVHAITRTLAGEPVPVDGWKRTVMAVAVGWLWAGAMAASTLSREFVYANDDQMRHDRRMESVARNAPTAGYHPTIVLVGAASAAMPDAWRVRGRIIAQVFRPDIAELSSWPDPKKNAMLASLRRFQADLIWVLLPDGALGMLPGK